MALAELAIPQSRLEIVRSRLKDLGIRFVIYRSEHIFQGIPVGFVPGAKESYLDARRRGYTSINTLDHQVHLDGLGAAIAAHELTKLEHWHGGMSEYTKGHVLILADSMNKGHQGRLLQKGLDEMRPILNRYGVEDIGATRKLDKDRYGDEQNNEGVEAFVAEKVGKENYDVIVFPEVIVQAGRTIPRTDGKTGIIFDIQDWMVDHGILERENFGMQRFDGRPLVRLIRLMEGLDKKVAITPISINGTNRLLKPTDQHTTIITSRGIASVVVAPFNLGIVSITVGITETFDDIKEAIRKRDDKFTSQAFGDYVGNMVAVNLPESKRGVYKKAA